VEFKEANMGYLLDLSGGDHSIIREMITLFLEQTPKDLQTLSSHIADKNWSGTQAMAHHIKPTLGYVGAEDMRLEIQQIEEMAKLPEVPAAEIAERFRKLTDRFQVLLSELKIYLDNQV
jgi:HPt (histidine-containing phosphotransfer) domain-containing protein